jgi:two-component system nitrate/nitrite sensor histidine kinase NarX
LGYLELPDAAAHRYFSGPEGSWLLTRQANDSRDRGWQLFLHGSDPVDAPPSVIEHASFVAGDRPLSSLVSAQIPAVGGSIARMFLVDPSVDDAESMLGAIVHLASEVGPSVLVTHERRRLRKQVRAEERALLARELHDGVIQSLLALEIRTHLLKRQAGFSAPARDLALIEDGLHQQIIALRELTENLRPREIQPAQLVNYLQSLVERFRRETRIAVTFTGDAQELDVSTSTCREVVRIVQEALANIRRHSAANSAEVRLQRLNDQWLIEITDDGKGFPFSGRLTLDDLDRTLQGPRVIKESVRALGGELTIDSGTWRGARLEIRIPLSTGYAVA